jgi:hypothetical protein
MKEKQGDGTFLNLATLEMRPKANPRGDCLTPPSPLWTVSPVAVQVSI